MDTKDFVREHLEVLENIDVESIRQFSTLLTKTIKSGGKIIICGNGGSAADSQHFAAELTGRYKKNRKPLPGIALTTDTSALTAISNDFGYEYVFSRRLEAIGGKKDVLILISTSGNSLNLIHAAHKAKELGIKILGLLGKKGGNVKYLCDNSIVVSSDNTPRIQEMHIFIIHMICELLDQDFS